MSDFFEALVITAVICLGVGVVTVAVTIRLVIVYVVMALQSLWDAICPFDDDDDDPYDG